MEKPKSKQYGVIGTDSVKSAYPADKMDTYIAMLEQRVDDADRQRGDYVSCATFEAMQQRAEAAEAKLADMDKQKPVAWIVHAHGGDQLTQDGDYVANVEGMHGARASALFTRPAPAVSLAELVHDDYFASLVSKARTSADKAMVKFPQPNYVLLKIAEEAGEVVQAGVHYAENRMTWQEVEGEIVQLMAMLIRLVTEGDQVNGITPPDEYRAAMLKRSRWILCSERMPPAKHNVYLANTDYADMKGRVFIGWLESDKHEHFFIGNQLMMRATHWMEIGINMPAAPKEDK